LNEIYIPGNTLLHRFNPDLKLFLTLFYIVIAVTVTEEQYVKLFLLLVPLLIILVSGKIPFKMIILRIIQVMPVIFFMVLFLYINKILNGKEYFIKESLSITLKPVISILSIIVLTSTTEFSLLMKSLKTFRVPDIIVNNISFMYRYMFILTEEVRNMLIARNSRYAGGFSIRQIKILGNMAGVLFLRTLERSERIYNAMLSRGYNGEIKILQNKTITVKEVILSITFACIILYLRFFI
jgi:cobalt/nickel transport system permease protein